MIFIDTSAFISLMVEDEFHGKAVKWWSESSKQDLLTSNLVAIETLGWIRYKAGKTKAIDAGKRFFESGELKIERVTNEDEKHSWRLFQKLNGRGISMIDCTSFAVMKRLGIKQAFAFDQDFADVGFNVLPEWSLIQ